jgi:hypothetical protein
MYHIFTSKIIFNRLSCVLNKCGKKQTVWEDVATKDKIFGLENVRKTVAKLSLIVITLAFLSTYYLFDRILSYFTHKSHGVCSMYFHTRALDVIMCLLE